MSDIAVHLEVLQEYNEKAAAGSPLTGADNPVLLRP